MTRYPLSRSANILILSPLLRPGMSISRRVLREARICWMMSSLKSAHTNTSFTRPRLTILREDVITLQNPHGMPPASIPSASTKTATQQANEKQVTKPKPGAVNTVKEKAAVPCGSSLILSQHIVLISTQGNISPYSNGLPGASLTSTSVDPTTNTSTKLLWDEVRFAELPSADREWMCLMILHRRN